MTHETHPVVFCPERVCGMVTASGDACTSPKRACLGLVQITHDAHASIGPFPRLPEHCERSPGDRSPRDPRVRTKRGASALATAT